MMQTGQLQRLSRTLLPLAVLTSMSGMLAGCFSGEKVAAERAKELSASTEKVSSFFTKLGRIEKALPTTTPTSKCPKQAKLKDAPVLDVFTLEALVNNGKRVRISKLLRSELFDDRLAAGKAKITTDAGYDSAINDAASVVKEIEEQPYVIVLRADQIVEPKVVGEGFTGGVINGAALVVDWRTEQVVCGAPIAAASSDSLKTGGGVGVKLKGVRVGSVGGTSLSEAVDADFKAQVSSAISKALADAT